MVKMKLKNFSSEDHQFERLVKIRLKLLFSEDDHFWRLSTVEMRLKNFSFGRRLILAIMNGQIRTLGNFFVDIGQFLPLLTVKIELSNFFFQN